MGEKHLSAAELYGKGIFTTIAIHDGQPFLWDKHWRRIVANARALEIDLSAYSQSTTLASLNEVLKESSLENGRARVNFSDLSPSRIWSNRDEKRTSLSIIVAERRTIPENLKITISPHRINTTSPLTGIKSCNYLDHLLAYQEAANRGFHEAIRLNERGEVASGCMVNVFWEKDRRLFTPRLKTGCLAGTTREFVLENAACKEVETDIEELGSAERMFLTSAGIGVVAVAEFEGRRLDKSPHPLTQLIS